jgi:hypothetical protein
MIMNWWPDGLVVMSEWFGNAMEVGIMEGEEWFLFTNRLVDFGVVL